MKSFVRAVGAAICASLIAAIAAIAAATAEPIDYFKIEGVDYDPRIPTPDEFFGHGLGEKPVRHDRLVAYLQTVAAMSDRFSIETIGHTHEGRPILFMVVTDPANHGRIDEIRAQHVARTNPRADRNAAADSDAPVVLWLNYGVHGAESAGMDAAAPVAYHLAAARGDDIEAQLREAVILITAIFNPDGHSRRVNHVYTYLAKRPVADPAHIQHNLWLEARTNHYWFDLNRQWLPITQPEAQAWMAKWHDWKPNISVDYHEMGTNSTYYFHPGEPRRLFPLAPEGYRDMLGDLAGYHARWLDAEAKLYYTEEGFDNFYIGKGSTYPSVNGGLGVLFEVGAARGGLIESDNGERRYAENIHYHFGTSLTSIEGAIGMKDRLFAHQRNFFAAAMRDAQSHPVKAYVFDLERDRARLDHFVETLRRHRIEVYSLARDVNAGGRVWRAGSAMVAPLAQAQHRLIRSVFERFTDFEENIFYDVSGWTLPLAFDVDYAELTGRQFQASMRGAAVESVDRTQPAPDRSDYSYVFSWSEYYAPRALYRLKEAGVYANIAVKPMALRTTQGDVRLPRGSVVVPLAWQTTSADEIYDIMATIAREDGIAVHAATSGRTETEGVDLGARNSIRAVEKPSVLLLIRDGLATYDAGEVWHLLDFRMHIPVVMREKDGLSGIDWSRYTHLVLVDGASPREQDVDAIKRWVRGGGTVIAMKRNALWAQEHLLGLSDDGADEDSEDEAPQRFDYAELPVKNAEHVIGGAIFESDLDITHPLGLGHFDRSIASMRNTTVVLQTPKSPVATIARYTDEPLLSGYASEKRIGEIAGSPMMTAERMGAGAVVLFADNPNFRAMFYGANKLFLNAIFFSRAFDSARSSEDGAESAHDALD